MDLVELTQRLDQEFSDFSFGKSRFPMLFQTGLQDSAVHSAGVSYLLALGIEFGLPAIAEYPMLVHANELWKRSPKVMPDSVWFHPQTLQPWISFEFERFENGDELKIQEKTRNLAISYYQSSQTLELCVLVYWLRSGIAPRSIDPLVDIFRRGFKLDNFPIPAPKCPLFLYKFVFCQTKVGAINNNRNITEVPAAYVTNSEKPTLINVCSATKIQK
jgi:hypothetical protein